MGKAGLWQLMFQLNDYVPFRKLKRFLVASTPSRAVRDLKRFVDTMDERSYAIYYDKRRALLTGDEALKQQIGEGKDIMSVLRACFSCRLNSILTVSAVRANIEAAVEDRLPEEEVIAQMSSVNPTHLSVYR